MSLINKMLQDLAQRQVPPSINVPSQINPLEPPRTRKTVPVWVWIVLMVLINIATVAWFSQHTRVQPNPGATQARQTEIGQPRKPISPSPLAQIKPPMPQAAPPGGQSLPRSIPTPEAKPLSIAPQAANAMHTSQSAMPTHANSPDNSTVPADILAIPAISPPVPHAQLSTGTITINKQTKQLTPAQLAQNEYLKALSLAQQGDREAAIAGFGQVLSLDPHYHQARLMLVGLLIEDKHVSEAERLLQESLTDDPKQVDFAMLLARLQVEHGGISASIATLMRSLPFATNQADYQAFLAALLQRTGQNDQAIEHYTIALKQNPQSGLWWMGLGISERDTKHLNEAHEAFARAKASNSLSPDLQAFVDQQLQQP